MLTSMYGAKFLAVIRHATTNRLFIQRGCTKIMLQTHLQNSTYTNVNAFKIVAETVAVPGQQSNG